MKEAISGHAKSMSHFLMGFATLESRKLHHCEYDGRGTLHCCEYDDFLNLGHLCSRNVQLFLKQVLYDYRKVRKQLWIPHIALKGESYNY